MEGEKPVEEVKAVEAQENRAPVSRKHARRERKQNRINRRFSLEKDIRYLGPLSYREFKILGWVAIVFSQVAVLINLATKVNPSLVERFSSSLVVLDGLADLALPLILLSNFTRILNNESGYKRQLLMNGSFAVAIILLYAMFFYHFLLGSIAALTVNPKAMAATAQTFFRNSSKTGFFCFNIFIDLFLCTLFQFFMDYRPQHVFTGKKIVIFRLFAILPIAYEAAAIMLKGLSTKMAVTIPFFMFPMLPVKPPMTFLLFVALVLWVKTREWRFCRRGGTKEEFKLFLKTNRNSLHFSIFTAVAMVVAGVIDLIVFFTTTMAEVLSMSGLLTAQSAEAMGAASAAAIEIAESGTYQPVALAMGFGQSISLIMLAPFVLLYSYTRKRKNPLIDTAVPFAGIVVILLVYIQGFYQIMHVLPFSGMIDLEEIMSIGSEFLSGGIPL